MSDSFTMQLVVTVAVVLVAIGYLIVRAVRAARRRNSAACDCGCSPAPAERRR